MALDDLHKKILKTSKSRQDVSEWVLHHLVVLIKIWSALMLYTVYKLKINTIINCRILNFGCINHIKITGWIFFNPGMTWQGPLKSFTSWAAVSRSYQLVTSGLSSQYLENWVWIMQPHCSWHRLLLCLLVIFLFNLLFILGDTATVSHGAGEMTQPKFSSPVLGNFWRTISSAHWLTAAGSLSMVGIAK